VWLRKSDHLEVARVQLEESGFFDRIPPEQHAAIIERQARLLPVFAGLGPTVILPIVTVLIAGFFLFVYRFFYASDTTFRQSLAVLTWASLAYYALLTVLTALVMTLKNEWSIDPHSAIQASPVALFEKAAVPKPLYVLLEELDLFWIWLLLLLSAGYAAATRRTVRSAATGVLASRAVILAIKVALAAVF
jgi:Yip1 domain